MPRLYMRANDCDGGEACRGCICGQMIAMAARRAAARAMRGARATASGIAVVGTSSSRNGSSAASRPGRGLRRQQAASLVHGVTSGSSAASRPCLGLRRQQAASLVHGVTSGRAGCKQA